VIFLWASSKVSTTWSRSKDHNRLSRERMKKAIIQVPCDEGNANRISDSVPFLVSLAGTDLHLHDYDYCLLRALI